jgi:hypothetical protein
VDLKEILLTHHSSIASRDQGVAFINQHPEFFPSLLELTCTPQEKRENILASWILEKYVIEKLSCLDSHLIIFLKGAKQQTNESKKRAMAKILYYYCRNEDRRKLLSTQKIDLIIDICFSYLLTFKQLAPLCFALKTLHFFRKHQAWIEEEMQAFVEKNLPNSSPGFRAAVRQIS